MRWIDADLLKSILNSGSGESVDIFLDKSMPLKEIVDTVIQAYRKCLFAEIDKIPDAYNSVDCDGEWIYCGDKDNLPNKSGEYQAIFNTENVFEKINFDASDGTWFDDYGQYHDVIAWWKAHPYESFADGRR